MRIPVPTTNRQALWIALGTILVLPLVVFLPNPRGFLTPTGFLSLHTFLELFAVAVAILVVGIGWNARQGPHSGHMAVLSTGFLAVGMLDLAHTLSYVGMPDFVTPSGVEKGIYFWLAARFSSAVTLLTVTLAPGEWRYNARFRMTCAAISVGFIAMVYYIVLFQQALLPHTFIAGSGLTPLKKATEYLLCCVYATSAALIWLRPVKGAAFRGPVLLAALLIFTIGELAFTLYSTTYDGFNIVGHLYKVIATYLIYRAVFVDAVAAPYINLFRSERKYREILEQAPDGIIRVNPQGVIIEANRHFEAMTGLSPDAALGRPIKMLVEHWPSDSVRPAVREDGTVLWESRLLPAASANMPVEINARWLETGEIQAILRDISDWKSNEHSLHEAIARAEQANQAKSQFLANMSHELRTPLNAIMGFSELIKSEAFGAIGDPHYRDYANDIHRSGKHLLSIINDVLDIARIEAGQVTLEKKEIDLAAVVKDCVHIVSIAADNVRVSISQLPSPLTICAEERAMRQIILNLLSNAVKFAPAGGSVDVAVRLSPSADVNIVVSDTGIGMAPAVLDRITGAFYQVESAYARKHQGVGLGLSIAKALVEMHGGRLDFDSVPGSGTRAIVTLPQSRLAIPSLAVVS
jgi:PAS domain S-box-containing protein